MRDNFRGNRMKFLVVTDGENVSRFAADEVRSYHIVSRPRVRKKPAHHVVIVEMKPVKQLDSESHGVVVDRCREFEWRFDTFEMARDAVQMDG